MYTVGHSRLISTGVYLPNERVTSRDLLQQIDSNERFGLPYDWLERSTGIRERRVAPSDMRPSDLAAKATLDALEEASISPGEIDAIIYAGVIRDHIEPATAHIVQHKIGAKNAIALDVSNACLGFMSAIHLMDALIATGQVRHGLVVTGERGYDYAKKAVQALRETDDRKVFNDLMAGLTLGDAGAAIVMGPKLGPDSGFMGFMVESQGEFYELCVCDNGEGGSILRTQVTAIVSETAKLVGPMFSHLMKKLRWGTKDLDRYIPHQVGLKSIRIHANLTAVPLDIIPITVDLLGNVVSATIPINLYFLNKQNKLHEGQKIYLSGTGSGICLSQAGLVWDAA